MSLVSDIVASSSRIQLLEQAGRPMYLRVPGRPAESGRVLVAIPDLHLLNFHSAQDNFRFGAYAFLDFLMHLRELQASLRPLGVTLTPVQLGDMYELCHPPLHSGRPLTVEDIVYSSPIYEAISRYMDEIGTLMIYGNHDYVRRLRADVHYSLHLGDVYLEHGYSADRWYHFSNPQRKFWSTGMAGLTFFRRIEGAVNNYVNGPENRPRTPFGLHPGYRDQADTAPPHSIPQRRIDHFRETVERVRTTGGPVRVCVTAHSHLPDLLWLDDAQRTVFVDAGAWTEGRSDFAIIAAGEVALARFDRSPVLERNVHTEEVPSESRRLVSQC